MGRSLSVGRRFSGHTVATIWHRDIASGVQREADADGVGAAR